MKVRAPGKLILSGEHAVLHGAPAVAIAVNRYATATIDAEVNQKIFFDFSDLAHKSYFTMDSLRIFKDKIKKKYHKFLRGEYTIRDVLHKPFELAQIALGVLTESNNISLSNGVKIHMQSDIPIGCGMGSSAATILSIMYATAAHLKMNMTDMQLFDAAIQAENMQHGKSSGLDLRVVIHGGCLFFQDGKINTLPVPTFKMYLVNTGQPVSSTGECVTTVASRFKDLDLIASFTDVTLQMVDALEQNDIITIQSAIRTNHRLLVDIGVVPARVSEFIDHVERLQGAAKICGAGSVSGERGGLVLVVMDDIAQLKKLCKQYHYDVMTVACEPRGVHVV